MQQAYERVVRQLLDQGTTTASYYATIHPHASYILAKEVDRQGQRAYVGKVNSDMLPMAEQNESVEKSLEGTREFIHLVQGLNSPTVSPIISPRFGMGCSWELMEKLGDLARTTCPCKPTLTRTRTRSRGWPSASPTPPATPTCTNRYIICLRLPAQYCYVERANSLLCVPGEIL